MDWGGGRGWHSWLRGRCKQDPGTSRLIPLGSGTKHKGRAEREMRSARLASGAGMPRKGIWIGFLASGGFRREWGWQWDESLCLCCGWRREQRGRRPEVGHQWGWSGARRRVWVRDGKGQARGGSNSSSSRGRSGGSGPGSQLQEARVQAGP